MHGSFVRYAVASADMADRIEQDGVEGFLSKDRKPKSNEQLVLLHSAFASSC